jgi:predicted DNA-binding transcriptional regulator AlpA
MQIRRIELQYSSQYKSQYPPAQSTTWVKANYYSSSYYPWFTTDPTHSLSGSGAGLYWFNNSPTNNRFHIDLGCPEIINRIYYENHHNGGADTDWGAKTFTLWGSNTASAFADLTYGDDTNWTQITGLSQSTLDQHTAADFPDPKFITITGNTTAFRYYAFKFADNWTNGSDMGVRRIELQTDKPFFFPPLNNAVYVEATTQDIGNSYQATDKTLALTGAAAGNSWIATATGSQRFHIDLAFAQVINKLYYENYHNSGANTTRGAKTFTLWGSNTASAFADLTYGDDTNWTQITGLSQSTFDQHTGSDIADPKFITFPNTTAFRYYAIKIADNWTDGTYVGLRRIQLQCTQ